MSQSTTAPSGGLHIGLWVLQVLLALMFLGAGGMKSLAPLDELAKNMPWVGYSPGWMVRFVGVSEVLGAIGLVVPAATRIVPVLTPVAAALLALVMALAAGMHAMHAEWGGIPVNIVLGGLFALVAWGRFVKAPIPAR